MAKRGTIDWITPAEFQALAEKSATPASVRDKALRKEVIPDEIKAVDDEARTIQFRITTGCRDRDRDTINPMGWKLENYLRNPVVLWAHDYHSLPIAKALSLEARTDGLSSVAQFVPSDMSPFADTVYRMLKGGFLNATSVGFRPLAWVYDEEARGVNFSEQELLEFSIVPVPANPEALVEVRSAGIDTAPLLTWAEDTLDGWKKEDGLYVSKAQVEAVFRILSAYKVGMALPAKVSPPEVQTPEEVNISVGVAEAVRREVDVLRNNTVLITEKGMELLAVLKRGRVLSRANESALKVATDKIAEGVQSINGVLAQVATAPEDTEEEASAITEQRSEDLVLDITEPAEEAHLEIAERVTPEIQWDAAQIEPIAQRVAPQLIAAAIAEHVGKTINRLRGRVD